MTVLLPLLLAAFEFSAGSARSWSMLAGAAAGDWQAFARQNPAAAACADRLVVGVAYCQPYRLAGLNWGQVGAAARSGRWAAGLAAASLLSQGYRENDWQVVLAARPLASLCAGVGVHLLSVSGTGLAGAAAPAFDAGLTWEGSSIRVSASGMRVNVPRFANGDEVPLRVTLGAAARPVEPLLLCLDLSREGSVETAALGAEFNLVPPLDLRAGVSYEPLCYALGFGVRVGFVTLDYAYRFHPQLKETHLVGIQGSWD